MDLKKGFLSSRSSVKGESVARLKKEKKLKRLSSSEFEKFSLSNHEFLWMAFVSELQLFGDDCVDELAVHLSDFEINHPVQSLFVQVMTSVVSKRYHHKLIDNDQFDRGLQALTQVSELEAQVKHLQSTTEDRIQIIDTLTSQVQQLEVEIQCLLEKNLALQNRLQVIEASHNQGGFNLSRETLTKLRLAQQFGIIVPSETDNLHLLQFKKHRVQRICFRCGHTGHFSSACLRPCLEKNLSDTFKRCPFYFQSPKGPPSCDSPAWPTSSACQATPTVISHHNSSRLASTFQGNAWRATNGDAIDDTNLTTMSNGRHHNWKDNQHRHEQQLSLRVQDPAFLPHSLSFSSHAGVRKNFLQTLKAQAKTFKWVSQLNGSHRSYNRGELKLGFPNICYIHKGTMLLHRATIQHTWEEFLDHGQPPGDDA